MLPARSVITLVALAMLIGFEADAFAQGARAFSKDEFTRSCAPCHGVTGKGDGPVARSLTRSPADLTRLSQKNGGVFPLSSVVDVIDGRAGISAHGPRDMPVWGDVYIRELQNQWRPDILSNELAQLIARVRILMLVEYISTLQEK